MRWTERSLVDEYRALVTAALEQLADPSAGLVTAIASLADEFGATRM
jgi:hypothetical protein